MRKSLIILLCSLIILMVGCEKKNLEDKINKETNDHSFTIIDKSKDIPDFVCATALEKFYEDENYSYSWPCIMNDYIIVKYENKEEKLVSEALKNKEISIQDLDRFNIKYIKEFK